jgi:hypothetical protein
MKKEKKNKEDRSYKPSQKPLFLAFHPKATKLHLQAGLLACPVS